MRLLFVGLGVLVALTFGMHGHGHHKHHQPTVQCTLPVPGQLTPDNCLVVA